MDRKTKDAGVIAVTLERLNKIRLPRAQAIKEKVDNGETLNDFDIEFLGRAYKDAKQLLGVVGRNPEYVGLLSSMIQLCDSITKGAIENEKK